MQKAVSGTVLDVADVLHTASEQSHEHHRRGKCLGVFAGDARKTLDPSALGPEGFAFKRIVESG